MKYLLIDLGATYIKCVVYDKETGDVSTPDHFTSPFRSETIATSEFLYKLLDNIVTYYDRVDGVVICTILGGTWRDNVYYSWKAGLEPGQSCLIGGLFGSLSHEDHKPFTTANEYVNQLTIIGSIHETPVYCALGDTNCVIRSLELKEDEVAINMGTGSQVITMNGIQRYFPAGRSFLVYQELFGSMGLNIFELFNNLTLEDVTNSPLEVDLATFEQARGYVDGGSISKIKEGSFTINNLLGALVRSFITQYKDCVGDAKRIILVGGIAKKLQLTYQLFNHYYPQTIISMGEQGIESTHKGMIKCINEQL